MNAEILSIGDELLIGQVVNTNASWLGEQLALLGIPVRRITAVGDSHDEVLRAFQRAWSEQEIVIVTGGLGPTHDDVTRAAVCDFFRTSLVQNDQVLADIEHMFARRKRALSDVNRDQAMVPSSAAILRNTQGTAPGYHFSEGGKHFFVTPGVPYEMHGMFERDILPVLQAQFRGSRVSRTLLTTGIAESTLADLLAGIDTYRSDGRVAFLPSPMGVRIRLTAEAAEEERARETLEDLQHFVTDRASEYLFGTGTQTLEEVVGSLLVEHGQTLAVAESCTGGLITDKITNVSGSSSWFERGVVAYSNISKVEILGTDASLIQTHGAVSSEVACAMADGIRIGARSSIGLATTGIAGPAGGSEEKPVGLVWIAISTARETLAHAYYFGDHRIRTKQRAAQAALDMVRRRILALPPIPSTLTEAS